ncbi:MAG: hypothetical protein EBE86_034900 [Hormoscilla sp. GUM202]|nr:hypothetical protein [Hormoscilla sp. GUM202]
MKKPGFWQERDRPADATFTRHTSTCRGDVSRVVRLALPRDIDSIN